MAKTEPTVTYSLPCVRCGYDLRMLAADGRCPECGMPVALTISLGGELSRTRPGYVRRLAWASAMLVGARAFAFAMGLIPLFSRADRVFSAAVFLLCLVLAFLLCLVGAWLLTAREHPHLPLETPRAAVAIRLVTLAAVMLLAPFLLDEFMRQLSWSHPFRNWVDQHSRLLECANWIAAVLCILYPALEMHIMVRLSRRLSNQGLGQRALVSGISGVIAGMMVVAIILVMGYFPRIEYTPYSQPLMYACGAMMCVLLVSWLWTAYNCLLACRIFAKASREAAARWELCGKGPAAMSMTR